MKPMLHEIVQAGGVASVVIGAGLTFGGLGLIAVGLIVVAAIEVIHR